jgi:hypothetical protein
VYKLTVRDGPKVSREKHESLEGAIAALRAHTERIRAEGDLPAVSLFRTYEPGDRVRARLEISAGGVLRSRDAGIDVMGDGGLVPFRGGVFRKQIDRDRGDTAFDAVERVFAEAGA